MAATNRKLVIIQHFFPIQEIPKLFKKGQACTYSHTEKLIPHPFKRPKTKDSRKEKRESLKRASRRDSHVHDRGEAGESEREGERAHFHRQPPNMDSREERDACQLAGGWSFYFFILAFS